MKGLQIGGVNRGSELVRQQILILMAEKRISKAELARRIGEDRLWVQRRLNPTEGNKSTITADEIPILARALGVSILDLYTDQLPPKDAAPNRKEVMPYRPSSDIDKAEEDAYTAALESGAASFRANLRQAMTYLTAAQRLLENVERTEEQPTNGQ